MDIIWFNVITSGVQIAIGILGGTALMGLLIYLLKGAISAWINRQFLAQNTIIVEEARQKFTHELEDHRAKLTNSLDAYRLDLNKSLEDYKSKLSAELATQVEPLKASLSRENIGYQITHTEYVRRQFLRIEELFSLLLEVNRFVLSTYSTAVDIDEEAVIKMQEETYGKIREVETKIHVAAFFLPPSTVETLFEYTGNIITMVEVFEGYWDAAKSARDKSYDPQEHKDAVETAVIERKHYQTQKGTVRKQFMVITQALQELTSASTKS